MKYTILLLIFLPLYLFFQFKEGKGIIYKGLPKRANHKDEQGRKQGLWYESFMVGYFGHEILYNTVYIGKYKNGKREGVWKHYYKTMITNRTYDKIMENPNFSYNIYKNDTLHFLAKAIYHHGELEGKFIYGKNMKTDFKHNKINGLYEYKGNEHLKYYCKDNKIVKILISTDGEEKIGDEPPLLYFLRPYIDTEDFTKYQKDNLLIE